MFDIGFWEIIVIAIVALLVVGPDKLPGLIRETSRPSAKLNGKYGWTILKRTSPPE